MKRLIILLLFIPGLLHAQLINLGNIVQPAAGSPSILVSPSSLPQFNANQGSPSTSAFFTLSGSGLTTNLVVTAPTGYEVSKDNSNWAASQSYTPSSGIVASTSLYVRTTAAATGTPAGNVACTSTGAATRNVAVTAVIVSNSPTITLSTLNLAPITYTTGNPSSAQTYTVSGTNLTAGVLVTPPSWLEMSTDGTTYSGSAFTLPNTGTILTGQPVAVYARGKGSNAAGAYSGNITHTSAGATQQDIAANATVNAAGSTTAKFNLSQAATPITGWTNIFGPNGTDKQFTDAPTGWICNLKGTLQDGFFGNTYAFDGDGAASSSDPLFPANTVANIFVNAAAAVWTGSNYLFEFPNLPAGNYTVYFFPSVKSTWNSSITNPEFHVKFGAAADQMQNSINLQNNTSQKYTFTGTLGASEILKLSFNPPVGLNPGAAADAAFIIQKN